MGGGGGGGNHVCKESKMSRDHVNILCRCILSDGRRSSGRNCHHAACGATLWIWGRSDGCVPTKAEEKEDTKYIVTLHSTTQRK